MDAKMIGIVGGVGPFAGLDLQRKILAQTAATRDQDYLTVLSLSQPGLIVDRTEYLLGRVAENPAHAFVEQIARLHEWGATVVGIPCNTAHAPRIFDVIEAERRRRRIGVTLLHMIRETAVHLQTHFPHVRRVGVLATSGARRACIYPTTLAPLGYDVLYPPPDVQDEVVHRAIYDPVYGIKAGGVSPRARADLQQTAVSLVDQGAEAIILGCTEIPLALPQTAVAGAPLIDTTLVLARALIRAVDAARLRPFVKRDA